MNKVKSALVVLAATALGTALSHIHFKETYALLLLIDVDGCHQGISRIRHVTSVR